MEIIVFTFYGMTMVILLIKSKFVTIGIDSSYQFEPAYMSYLANRIVYNINFDMKMNIRSYDETEKYYVDKVRKIPVDGTTIKIKLSK